MQNPEKPGPLASLLVKEETSTRTEPACAQSAAQEKPKPDQYVSKSLAAVERAWRESGSSKRQLEGKIDGNGTWFSGCFDES